MSEPCVGQRPAADQQWPERLLELAERLAATSEPDRRRERAAELAAAIRVVLYWYVQYHGAKRARFEIEDARDIAATKAVELFEKLQQGRWSPAGWSAPRLRGFLSSVARNGVIDQVRAEQRAIAPSPPEPTEQCGSAQDRLRAILFCDALSACLSGLRPRARTTWFLKVFYGMTSREAGRHPALGSSSAAVDMAWMRSRTAIRRCMKRKGFDASQLPSGTFARIWRRFDVDRLGPE